MFVYSYSRVIFGVLYGTYTMDTQKKLKSVGLLGGFKPRQKEYRYFKDWKMHYVEEILKMESPTRRLLDHANAVEWICTERTGLYDSEWKKIFEWDVVKWSYPQIGVVQYIENLTRDSWGSSHSGYYCKEWLTETSLWMELFYWHNLVSIKVIGNVFESPLILDQ